MKKLLMLLVCIAPFVLTAQIEQGKWLVGGSFMGKYEKSDATRFEQKRIDLNTQLNVGYFALNNLALGIRGQYGYSKSNGNVTFDIIYNWLMFEAKETSYMFGPFARVYFLPRTSRFNLYSEFFYAFGNHTYKTNLSQMADVEMKSKLYNVNIAPVYFINKYTSVELVLGYYLQAFDNVKYTNLLVGAGFQLHLGGNKKGN